MDELTAWLTLTRAPGLHAGTLKQLLEQLHSVTSIVTASSVALRSAGASDTLIEWLQAPRDGLIDDDRRWLERDAHHFVPLGTPLYPPLLSALPDAPVALFVRGDPVVLSLPQLAMVGSRNPTASGRENAVSFAAHLARCGLTITSGLAIGIDAASHQGALDGGGRTLAVCGTGLDINYPRSNTALAEAIAARGALVSEFPLGTLPLKGNFPRRNRIISGLSLGTLVVEAAMGSGSLITARLAAEQGREVFAIPGSIHNPLARGCHRLIRQGAKLVETAEDIFMELSALAALVADSAAAPRAAERQANSVPVLDKEYEILLDALGFEPAGVDILVARTGLKADEVASMLLMLELTGRIEPCPGGRYVRRVLEAAEAK
jgi:DNA processing protein